MENSKHIENLRKQIRKASDFLSYYTQLDEGYTQLDEGEFDAWQNLTEHFLERAFGVGTSQVKKVTTLSKTNLQREWDGWDLEAAREIIDKQAKMLSASVEILEDEDPPAQSITVRSIIPALPQHLVDRGEELRENRTGRERTQKSPAKAQRTLKPINKKVFIVHGQNKGVREEVARYVENLDLEAIVLEEKPNEGRTVIEKFEDYSEVGFAIVLLTGDDQGGRKGQSHESQSLRARQNVILELGFFLAKIERRHVCALYEKGVELPSNYQGVIWIELDDHEGWKRKLAKELNAAKLPVNMEMV